MSRGGSGVVGTEMAVGVSLYLLNFAWRGDPVGIRGFWQEIARLAFFYKGFIEIAHLFSRLDMTFYGYRGVGEARF